MPWGCLYSTVDTVADHSVVSVSVTNVQRIRCIVVWLIQFQIILSFIIVSVTNVLRICCIVVLLIQFQIILSFIIVSVTNALRMCCMGERCFRINCHCICVRCKNCEDCARTWGQGGMAMTLASKAAGMVKYPLEKSTCLHLRLKC